MATREEKVELYRNVLFDKIGVTSINDQVIEGVVEYLGPSVFNANAELISSSDEGEMRTVRENYLKKKLSLDLPNEELDEAINEVIEEYGKSENKKYRAVVYYLLAQKFKKQDMFDK